MPLVAEPIPLLITYGHKFSKLFTLNDAEGQPVDFTGKKAKLQAKAPDGTVIFTLSTEAITKEGDITLGPLGAITLAMTGSTTVTLTGNPKGEYDMLLYTTADDAEALFGGTVGFRSGVTSV